MAMRLTCDWVCAVSCTITRPQVSCTRFKAGTRQFNTWYGTGFFDHLAASPNRLVAFQESMVARSQVEAADLLRSHDFSGYRHVVDVGGGFGVTLTAILTAYPALRGTLFDRPEVTQAAHARLTAAGVDARCRSSLAMLSTRFRAVATCTCSRASSTTGTTTMQCAFSGHAGARCVMTPALCWWKPSLPTSQSISRPPC